MDSEVRTMLLDQATRLLDAEVPASRLKELLEAPGSFDRVMWDRAVEQGWPGLAIAEEAGGLGLGLEPFSALLLELGQRTISLPLVQGYTVAAALTEGDVATDVAARIASGEAIAALAFAEPGEAGLTPSLRYDGALVTGAKALTAFGAVADIALVTALDGDVIGLYLVDLAQPEVVRQPLDAIDNARAGATLSFEGAVATPVLSGRDAVLRCASIAATLLAFEQVGGAERCLALAVGYAKERRVFGQLIGAFQAIKHKCADIYQELEIARGCAIDAREALEDGRHDFVPLAAAARLGAGAAYDFAARECIQTYGGIGVTWEAEPHHHYRRARALALELGGPLFWRDLLLDNHRALDTAADEVSQPADSLAGYVQRARAWLDAQEAQFGTEARRGLSAEEDLALARAYQRAKSDAGYACITLPRELGGGSGSEIEKILFGQEELRHNFPIVYYGVSLAMPIPMLLRYADRETIERLAPPAIRGEAIWCQLFSEPAAGSDLAALRLRAERDGDGWRLNGQKLWTSWAQVADYGIIVTRTDPTVAKHAGLTFFWVDMKSPGIVVKNVRKLAGESEVNEVFFDDVFVPDSQRMGAVGEGFKVAIETLMIERYSVGDDSCGGMDLAQFVAIAARARIDGRPAIDDGQVRRALADTLVERQGLRSIHRRALAIIATGGEPGPEGAIRKLRLARRRQDIGELALDMLGADGMLLTKDGTPTTDAAWSWLDAPGSRIAGGTDEILRNTIAEKVLGLPQDYRPDKRVPFNQIA